MNIDTRYRFAAAAGLILLVLGPPIMAQVKWNNPLDESKYTNGVRHGSYFSQLQQEEVGFCIYLPNEYADSSQKRYPVEYFLGGLTNNENTQQKRWIDILDAAINDGTVPPIIIVFPNPMYDSWYCDRPQEKVESTIIKELIPHIDASYRTIDARTARAVGGMSMGGYGALKLGFKYPQLFCSVVAYAPAIWNERYRDVPAEESNLYDILERNGTMVKEMLQIRLACGSRDSANSGHNIVAETDSLASFLRQNLGMEVPYDTLEGLGHFIRQIYGIIGVKNIGHHFEAFVLDAQTASVYRKAVPTFHQGSKHGPGFGAHSTLYTPNGRLFGSNGRRHAGNIPFVVVSPGSGSGLRLMNHTGR